MKNVGEYIDHYRVVSQQTQTEPLAYQLYRVESSLEAENLSVLKTWPEVRFISQMGIDTFTRQAQALVEFHAPFFLPIKGYGIDDDSHPYQLLPDEACTLETLAQRMRRADADPISVEEATTILREVGTALVAAKSSSSDSWIGVTEHMLLCGFWGRKKNEWKGLPQQQRVRFW